MTTTVAEFRIRFPAFSDPVTYPDPVIQLYLDDAANIYMGLDEARWCGKYNYAQAYLAAHLLVIGTKESAGQSGANAGPISAKTAGGVSVTRAVTVKEQSTQDEFLNTTSYGQQFLIVRNTCFVGVTTSC